MPVLIQPIPTTPTIKIIFLQGLNRASLNALSAFLSGLEKAGLLGFYQGMVSQFSLCYETSEPTRAARRRY